MKNTYLADIRALLQHAQSTAVPPERRVTFLRDAVDLLVDTLFPPVGEAATANFVTDFTMPSCSVCGEIMYGACAKCGNTTLPSVPQHQFVTSELVDAFRADENTPAIPLENLALVFNAVLPYLNRMMNLHTAQAAATALTPTSTNPTKLDMLDALKYIDRDRRFHARAKHWTGGSVSIFFSGGVLDHLRSTNGYEYTPTAPDITAEWEIVRDPATDAAIKEIKEVREAKREGTP